MLEWNENVEKAKSLLSSHPWKRQEALSYWRAAASEGGNLLEMLKIAECYEQLIGCPLNANLAFVFL